MRRRLHLAILVGAALFLSTCGGRHARPAGGTLAAIKQRGVLRWGGDVQGGEPYVYGDPDHLQGFEVEIADGIARRLGVKAEFVQIAWSSLVPALERGDMDIAMNGLENTPERRERLIVSKPYYIYAETLAVKQGSSLRFMDLPGHRVGTLNQTYAHELLRGMGIEPLAYEGTEEPYMDLVNGNLDAVVMDDVIANVYGCNRPGVQCQPAEGALGSYIVGIRKDDQDLADAINAALDDMKQTGELRAILERWHLWNARQEGPAPVSQNRLAHRQFDLTQAKLFLLGAWETLLLSLSSFALAVPFGLLLAIARIYGGPTLRGAATTYVEVFRGTPVLLQLYVLYFSLAPVLKLGAFSAAMLGLGLNYAAYESEVYRGALLAIPRGQSEAAASLGLSTAQTLRHVLLPQALRMALPAMTNDFVALLKDSSVVGVIAVVELTKRMTIAAVDLNDWLLPGFVCALLYFALSFPLAQLARQLERKLSRDPHLGAA